MNIELAKRAVACKRWRWMPGMLTINGTRIQRTPNVEITAAWPDLDDPATLGCLLALVREAWGDLGASVWHDRRVGLWSWMAGGCTHGVWRPFDEDGYTLEAEALVAALEAAP
jgi:hypothetical protein